jgi:hypothetical protein
VPLGLVCLAAAFTCRWLLGVAAAALLGSAAHSLSCRTRRVQFRQALQWFAGPVLLVFYEAVVMSVATPGSALARVLICAVAASCMAFASTSAWRRAVGVVRGARSRRPPVRPQYSTGSQMEFVAAGAAGSGALASIGSANEAEATTSASVASADNEWTSDFEDSGDEMDDYNGSTTAALAAAAAAAEISGPWLLARQSLDSVQEAVGSSVRSEVLATPWAFINTLVVLTGAIIYDEGVWNAWDVTFGEETWNEPVAIAVGLTILLSVRVFKIPLVSKLPGGFEDPL